MANQARHRFCSNCGIPLDPTRPRCVRCAPRRAGEWGPLLAGAGLVAALGAAGLLLGGRLGVGGLLQSRRSAAESHPAALVPVTSAPNLATGAHGAPVTRAPRHPHKTAPPVTGAARAEETLPPSMLLGRDAPTSPAPSASVLTAPARPDIPAAPSVVVAAPAAPDKTGPSVLGGGVPAGGSGTLLNGGWLERPSPRENPEIIIRNEAGGAATLVLRDGDRSYHHAIGRDGLRTTLQPGTYHYELQEEIYRHTGRPDQVGSLTCGRYHTYELSYFHRSSEETHVEHIGD